jgi:hypothetical protein
MGLDPLDHVFQPTLGIGPGGRLNGEIGQIVLPRSVTTSGLVFQPTRGQTFIAAIFELVPLTVETDIASPRTRTTTMDIWKNFLISTSGHETMKRFAYFSILLLMLPLFNM